MIDKQLKAMMDKKGLTLEKLSMLSNVPIETIRNIIYRRARNPRVDTLLALSRTLDVSMESLETSDGAAFSSFDVEHVKTACENVYMAMRLPNDHFSPRYCKNDVLLLSDKFPNEGENALFLYNHRLYFRQFHISEKGYALNTINGRGTALRFRRMDSCRLIGTCMAVQ